jgi:hypothetical protein
MSAAAAVETTSNNTITDADDSDVTYLKCEFMNQLWNITIPWDIHEKMHGVFTIVGNHFFSDEPTIPTIELEVDNVGEIDDDGWRHTLIDGDKTPDSCWGALAGQVYTVYVIAEEKKTK